MPGVEIPWGVYAVLVILATLLGGLLYWLCDGLFEEGFVGVILLFVILAFTTNVYTINVPEFHALTVLDNLWGTQRTVFQGRNAKLPWESLGSLTDVRTELKDVIKATWVTKEGAMMKGTYVYLMHTKRTPEGVLTYAGYEPDAVKMAARNLFSMMFSDHFGKNQPEDLLNKTPSTRRSLVRTTTTEYRPSESSRSDTGWTSPRWDSKKSTTTNAHRKRGTRSQTRDPLMRRSICLWRKEKTERLAWIAPPRNTTRDSCSSQTT